MRSLFLLLLAAGCAAGHARDEPATLENDGAWVRVFRTDRDTAFHAALAGLDAAGYTAETVNPLAGWFTATSEVRSTLGRLSYRRARVMIEPAPTEGAGMRVRLLVVRTSQPDGAGRRPNNDRPVTDRAVYDGLFARIAKAIET